MRLLAIAVAAATLLVPSVGRSQDSGRVGGLIGSNLEFTVPAHPAGSDLGTSAADYGGSFARAVICWLSCRARRAGSGQHGDDAR